MKNNRQFVIALLIILVICARLLFPELHFDDVSFKLLVVAVVVLLLPDLTPLFNRINHLKYQDFEIDLNELNRKTAVAEQAVKTSPAVHPEGVTKDVLQKLTERLSEPLASLVVLGQEMEEKIRSSALVQDIVGADKEELRNLLVKLAEKEVVAIETIPSFEDFWNMRKRILQNPLFAEALSKEQMYSFVDLGLRILGLLPAGEE